LYGRCGRTDSVETCSETVETYERIGGNLAAKRWKLTAEIRKVMRDPADPDDAVKAFADAAVEVLTRRVENAPAIRGESRWLPGWTNRVRRYPELSC
jgi:hypothetical protein